MRMRLPTVSDEAFALRFLFVCSPSAHPSVALFLYLFLLFFFFFFFFAVLCISWVLVFAFLLLKICTPTHHLSHFHLSAVVFRMDEVSFLLPCVVVRG